MTSPGERAINIAFWSGVFAGASGATVPFLITFYAHGGPVWIGVIALSIVVVSASSGLILCRRVNRGRHFAPRRAIGNNRQLG